MPEKPEEAGALAPGVYVKEVSNGARVITGAGTSTPAFLGYTVRDSGPCPPTLVRSWQEYTDRFATSEQGTSLFEELGKAVRHGEDAVLGALSAVTGGHAAPAAPGSDIPRGFALSEAVQGFFANGGASCYIVPLGDAPSLAAALEGDGEAGTGLAGLEKVPDVAMVACPDLAPMATTDGELAEGAQKIAAHCVKMRNRVAVLDVPHDPSGTPRTTAPELGLEDDQRKFAAVYYPWVKVSGLDGKQREVPPSGHVAGVWARTDARRGVHKAPANEAIQGVMGFSAQVTDSEQAHLNEQGVNCLRSFPGRDPLVWGARTLATGDTDWRYLNVRRLVCFIEDSIKQSTTWAAFEPNDERLWAALRHDVTAFLKDQWRCGALVGSTPAEAFYVICDESNNSTDTIAQGLVQCDIGVAPVRPAEFIHFTVQQTAGQPPA